LSSSELLTAKIILIYSGGRRAGRGVTP